ncbi:hypothetical protein BS47DRAFT_1361359 [Hydnum rufescens UP504]|uniref:Uncharacterized protein n=1 Tax=Hydnum rufescens UP504 TaxID=1448309 RepID=A0A9P6AZM2_9AGAM|nr:hypothetical protein BS47DRAFT_1361359 [Hydnum rufescens UP504]
MPYWALTPLSSPSSGVPGANIIAQRRAAVSLPLARRGNWPALEFANYAANTQEQKCDCMTTTQQQQQQPATAATAAAAAAAAATAATAAATAHDHNRSAHDHTPADAGLSLLFQVKTKTNAGRPMSGLRNHTHCRRVFATQLRPTKQPPERNTPQTGSANDDAPHEEKKPYTRNTYCHKLKTERPTKQVPPQR